MVESLQPADREILEGNAAVEEEAEAAVVEDLVAAPVPAVDLVVANDSAVVDKTSC